MEVHTLGLMQALIERGHGIELVANRFDWYDAIVRERGWQDRVRIIHTDLGGILYGDRTNRRAWRQVLQGLKSETLLFPKGNNNYGQLGFLRECRRVFRNIVFIEHLEPRDRPSGKSRRRLVPALGLWWHKRRLLSAIGARYADRIIAVSDKVRQRLVDDIWYPKEKVTVVRNGVPWREFGRNQERGLAVRERHQVSPHAFVFGMLSRLSDEKGIDTALLAFRLLVERHPDLPAQLVIAGEGYAAEKLKNLTTDLRLQDRVTFVGFIAKPEEILSAFDVILFSSRREGLPLGLLQGMAAGCIPIVTRISGMPEAVDSSDVGWVVAPENPEELSGAMAAVLALDRVSVAKMRRTVIRRIQQHFDVAESNRRILEFLES
jgi:glycosyltransferase involved in cell wall biosynthesis